MELSSVRALSSQVSLIALILTLKPFLGTPSSSISLTLSSVGMCLLVYSINVPRSRMGRAARPVYGLLASLASGWLFLAGYLIVEWFANFSGYESTLLADPVQYNVVIVVFWLYILIIGAILEVMRLRWKLSVEDIGGTEVAAFAGIVGMSGKLGSFLIIGLATILATERGKLLIDFLTAAPLRSRRKWGIPRTLESAEPITASLFLYMFILMPNLNVFVNGLLGEATPFVFTKDLVIMALLSLSFLLEIFLLLRGSFQWFFKLVAVTPFAFVIALSVVNGSLEVLPTYRLLLARIAGTVSSPVLFVAFDSLFSSIFFFFVALMIATLLKQDSKFEIGFTGMFIYPYFAWILTFTLGIQSLQQNSTRMMLILTDFLLTLILVVVNTHVDGIVFAKMSSVQLGLRHILPFLVVSICAGMAILMILEGMLVFAIGVSLSKAIMAFWEARGYVVAFTIVFAITNVIDFAETSKKISRVGLGEGILKRD
jgi:hypothetical protein